MPTHDIYYVASGQIESVQLASSNSLIARPIERTISDVMKGGTGARVIVAGSADSIQFKDEFVHNTIDSEWTPAERQILLDTLQWGYTAVYKPTDDAIKARVKREKAGRAANDRMIKREAIREERRIERELKNRYKAARERYSNGASVHEVIESFKISPENASLVNMPELAAEYAIVGVDEDGSEGSKMSDQECEDLMVDVRDMPDGPFDLDPKTSYTRQRKYKAPIFENEIIFPDPSTYRVGMHISKDGQRRYRAYESFKGGDPGDWMKNVQIFVVNHPIIKDDELFLTSHVALAAPHVIKHDTLVSDYMKAHKIGCSGAYAMEHVSERNAPENSMTANPTKVLQVMTGGGSGTAKPGFTVPADSEFGQKYLADRLKNRGINGMSTAEGSGVTNIAADSDTPADLQVLQMSLSAPPAPGQPIVPIPKSYKANVLPSGNIPQSHDSELSNLKDEIWNAFGISRKMMDSAGTVHGAGLQANRDATSRVTESHREDIINIMKSIVNLIYTDEIISQLVQGGGGGGGDGPETQNEKAKSRVYTIIPTFLSRNNKEPEEIYAMHQRGTISFETMQKEDLFANDMDQTMRDKSISELPEVTREKAAIKAAAKEAKNNEKQIALPSATNPAASEVVTKKKAKSAVSVVEKATSVSAPAVGTKRKATPTSEPTPKKAKRK